MIIDEINSGWGLICHLTIIISDKFNFNSKKYDIVPMGNYSKIFTKDKKSIYEL